MADGILVSPKKASKPNGTDTSTTYPDDPDPFAAFVHERSMKHVSRDRAVSGHSDDNRIGIPDKHPEEPMLISWDDDADAAAATTLPGVHPDNPLPPGQYPDTTQLSDPRNPFAAEDARSSNRLMESKNPFDMF